MKWLKTLSIISLCFFVIFFGVFFYIKKTFPPQKIKEITLSQLQKSFPKAKFKMKLLKTSFLTSLEIDVNEFEIIGSKGKSILKVERVKGDIPLLSLFKKSKAINLEFFNPVVVFRKNKLKNNFSETFSSRASKKEKKSSNKDILIPLLGNININLSLFKMNVFIKEKSKKARNILIEKLSLKNIGLNEDIEIKLISKIEINRKNKERNKDFFNLDIDGKVKIKELLSRGLIKTNLKFSILNFNNDILRLSPIKGNIRFSLNKEGDVFGVFNSKLSNKKILNSNFKISRSSIDLNNINIKINLDDLLKKRDFSNLEIKGGDIVLDGSLKIIKNKIYPNLNVTSLVNINLKRKLDTKIKLKTELKLNNKRIEIQSKGYLLNGYVKLSSLAKFNINKYLGNKNRYPFIRTTLLVKDLNIPDSLILSRLDNRNNKVNSKNDKKNNNKDPLSLKIPPGELRLIIKNTRLLGNSLNSNGRLLLKSDSVALEKLNLNFGEGKLYLTSLIKRNGKKFESKYKVILDKFNVEDVKLLVPKKLGKVKGHINIKSNGSFKFKSNVPFDERNIKSIVFDVNGINIVLEKLDINSFLKNYIKKLNILTNRYKGKNYAFSSGLDKLRIRGYFSKDNLNLTDLLFFGKNRSFEIAGKGRMYPFKGNKKGSISLSFIDHKLGIGRTLKKNTGSNSVPILLKTNKLSVSPDYGYTTKKVGSSFLRFKGKKEIKKREKKLKDSIKKELKKIIKKKSIKDLFNL